MYLSYTTVATLAIGLLGTSVSASPAGSIVDRSPINKYHLKTKVVENQPSTGTNKDGLYLFSSHIGAGLGAGGLRKEPLDGWYTYTGADNQQYFTYNGSAGGWPLQVEPGAYQAWTPVSISISGQRLGGQGFFFNGTEGLVYNNTNNGWLACDWSYGIPQLFLLQGGCPTDHPESCSKVELQIETIRD